MVPPGSRVLDVGTDRALLPRYLLTSGRAAFCIASERDRVRLSRVPAAARELRGLVLRAGDGLSVLEPEDRVEVVVVAGLGARAICRILRQRDLAALGVRRLVLQPETEPCLVRRALEGCAFGIEEERLVEEAGRLFTLIAAAPGLPAVAASGTLSRDDVLEVGPALLRSQDALLARYWRRELERTRAILARSPSGRGHAHARRRHELASRVLGSLERQTFVAN